MFAAAMEARSSEGSSRMSWALSAWRARRDAFRRAVRKACPLLCPVVSSRDLLYDEAKVTALASKSGMVLLMESIDDDMCGSDERSVLRWSDDVVVVRWDREERAWMEKRFDCPD